jgi:hypothetical protein
MSNMTEPPQSHMSPLPPNPIPPSPLFPNGAVNPGVQSDVGFPLWLEVVVVAALLLLAIIIIGLWLQNRDGL